MLLYKSKEKVTMNNFVSMPHGYLRQFEEKFVILTWNWFLVANSDAGKLNARNVFHRYVKR